MGVIFIEGRIDISKDVNLFNGDCLNIMRDIPNKSIDMIFTDLPYN